MSPEFDWSDAIEQLDSYPKFEELWQQDFADAIKEFFPKKEGLKVLEVGCSNGRWLKWFEKEFGAQTFGLDINPAGSSSVERFICGDALKLPFEDQSFDVVFSLGLIEHFDPKSRRLLLEEQARVLKEGSGIIVVEYPNLNPSLNMIYMKVYYDFFMKYHHYLFCTGEIRRHLDELGFEINTFRLLGWVPPRILRLVEKAIRKAIKVDFSFGDLLKKRRFSSIITADDVLFIGTKSRS